MKNLNLSLLQLQYIKSAMRSHSSVSASHFEATWTIDKAIEACKAKANADNDYAEKFYPESKLRITHTCSVNLTLMHDCEQVGTAKES